MKLVILVSLIALTFGRSSPLYNPLFVDIIEEVNSQQTTWTAGHNFARNVDYNYLKHLCGTFLDDPNREAMPGMKSYWI